MYFQIKVNKTGSCHSDFCKLVKLPGEFSRQTFMLVYCLHRQCDKICTWNWQALKWKITKRKKVFRWKSKKETTDPKKNKNDPFLCTCKRKKMFLKAVCLPKLSVRWFVIFLIGTFAGLLDFPWVVLLSLATLSIFVSFSLTNYFLLCNGLKKRLDETKIR